MDPAIFIRVFVQEKTGGLRNWICQVFHTCKIEANAINYSLYMPEEFRYCRLRKPSTTILVLIPINEIPSIDTIDRKFRTETKN